MTDIIQIEEQVVEGKRLGRHIQHDEKSRAFVAAQATKIISVTHRSHGLLPFDQGEVGSCTAEALTAAGNTSPNFKSHHTVRTQEDAYALYSEETREEGEPWPPNDPGGTCLAVCKAGVKMGWVKSYHHAFGLDQALKALVVRPVITGIAWYEGFDNPATNGMVSINGEVRGGHEIMAFEIDALHKVVWFLNSWGKSYGVNGRFA